MLSRSSACLVLPTLLSFYSLVGCAPSDEEPVAEGGSDLSTSQFDEACSEPVRSADGKYMAVDLCPKANVPGRIVRVDIASGEQAPIATYAATDRVDQLGSRGDLVLAAIRHAVDANGRATSGIDVIVRDWALSTERGRTLTPVVPTGVTGSFGALTPLVLSEDGSHVTFAAIDTALAAHLFVAPVNGQAAPVSIDLGVAAASLRWSARGNTLVGHQSDATPQTGEKLFVIEVGGDSVGKLVGSRHVDWASFEFGQGGTRRQEPFDGKRVVGFRSTPDLQSIGTVDPRTGEETVLDSAPNLQIVTDHGADVLYSRVTAVEAGGSSGFVRELVKQSREGGQKTVLVSSSGAAMTELSFGFEPLALSKDGAFGVFATRTGPTSTEERFLVRLDGSVAATKLDAKVKLLDDVGDLVLVVDASASPTTFKILDLRTGELAALAPAGGAPPILVGDGSIIQLNDCRTEAGLPGQAVKRTTTAGSETSTCAWMPWASSSLAVPGSSAVVFFASYGPMPNYRYDIGVVKP